MSNPLSSITVDVVHECTIVRRGLAASLSALPGVALSSEYASVETYLDRARSDHAAIALVSATATKAAGGLVESGAALIEVAAGFGDLEARQALRNGVMGLLLLSAEPEELLDALRHVALGQRYVTQAVAARVTAHVLSEALTLRECQILESLADGCCNKRIARDLHIAVGTVKTHVKSILWKLDVSSRTQAVIVAARRGIVRQIEPRSEPAVAACASSSSHATRRDIVPHAALA